MMTNKETVLESPVVEGLVYAGLGAFLVKAIADLVASITSLKKRKK